MKKKNLIAVIAIAVAAVILIGVLIWQLGGNDPAPTDPTETSTSSTEQGSTGETTAPTETTEPEETQPEETEPSTDGGETEPPATEPAETEPVETKPVETEPVETKPVETKPVETKPVETKPVETKPVETKPVETKPVETEPVETKPVETKPVETEPPATEPTVTFTEVNETVYATCTVNVRKGPSSNTEKLGSLSKGDCLRRIGIGDNGWSKVVYNGEEAYIYSDYLSKTKPAEETSEKTETSKDKEEDNSSEEAEVIVWTLPDGSTSTTPVIGATYTDECGFTFTYTEDMAAFDQAVKDYPVDDEPDLCHVCGRESGDGTNGTCYQYWMSGDYCQNCGEWVEAYTCHTCDED